MILQALARYYDILSSDPQSGIAPPAYSTVRVSFALKLSHQGTLLELVPLFLQKESGGQMIDVPRLLHVPEQVKRTQGISANFLCDNSTYVLGLSDSINVDPEYCIRRFAAFKQYNVNLLKNADCAAAQAVIAFLEQYDPHSARLHPALLPHLAKLLKNSNLVFMVDDHYVHEDATIKQIWHDHHTEKDAVWGQCLVTGEMAPIARLHPILKGVRDANPSGVSLVGFNAQAYESYNRTAGQGLNAPVSINAAFAYATALNYLLSPANQNRKFYVGDTTLLYWAESDKQEYAAAFASILEPELEEISKNSEEQKEKRKNRAKTVEKVRRTQIMDVPRLTSGLDGSTPFYILGLVPNIARLSVRFFISEPFEKIVQNLMQHYRDMEIGKEYVGQPTYINLRHILDETISKKISDPKPSALMAGAVLQAMLTSKPYPAALYNTILNRIRTDMDDRTKNITKINYIRAAVIKAFLLRKYRPLNHNPFEEVLIMSLNSESTIPAYVLGRLFAVLEKTQREAMNSETTIKDRYFTTACASPASVFPMLLKLSQYYLIRAKFGSMHDNQIGEILNLLDVENNPIPAHLSLDEQGIFVMGYYHQRKTLSTPEDTGLHTHQHQPESIEARSLIAA